MMHEREKSDPAIVAVKPTNKAEQSAAELAEPGRGPREMRASTARTEHRNGQPCHRRWSAYGKQQGKERRISSLRCFTTSVRIISNRHSSNSERTPQREWTG